MATATTETLALMNTHRKSRKPCFSFAAYAKSVISHLSSCHVHVTQGLSDYEFSSIESSLGFSFPPDLRSILMEGLPVGPGFPNWRSSSLQELHLLTSLPLLELSRQVSAHNFWIQSWGPRPTLDDEALSLARNFLQDAPVLVPVFRHCYVPSTPCLAGNPIFYVHAGDVRLLSNDVGGIFQEVEFWRNNWVFRPAGLLETSKVHATPICAANAARMIEFWSAVAEERGVVRQRRWWSGGLGVCLDDLMWRLRDGGWREEEVREMMMMDDGDDVEERKKGRRLGLRGRDGMVRHVRTLSRELLGGGWSIDDIVYSLDDEHGEVESAILEGESWVDFHYFDFPGKELLNLS